MKKIESLTQEQKNKFPEYIEKWTRIGLSTEPANRRLAEEGVIEAYKIAGKKPPKIIWCDSPLSMALTCAVVKEFYKNRASVWDSVGDSVWASVWDSVGASVRDSGYGQHDANWIGFYDFFRNECGLNTQTQKLLGLQKITENAGWFLPYSEICWISDRHRIVNQDKSKRLHCENGAAVEYSDGFKIYAWHGVRVPEWIILNPEQITPEKIFAKQNSEIRRVMTERYGFRRFGNTLIASGKAKLISEQLVWNEPVKYYHYKDSSGVIMGFVHVVNGTTEVDGAKHEFILTVKADNNNAEAAVLSTYPDLMKRLDNFTNKWDIIKKSIRS